MDIEKNKGNSITKKVLLIDHHDSFTYNLRDYLIQSNVSCMLFSEDELDIQKIKNLSPNGIVFSPGPQKPNDHPLMHDIISHFHQSVPILGICLGFQAIGTYFGATLCHAQQPMHGKVSSIQHNGHMAFNNIPEHFEVTRYHSLHLTDVHQSALQVTAVAKDSTIMSVVHPLYPVWGFQFHPEAILTQHGMQLIRNWTAFINIF